MNMSNNLSINGLFKGLVSLQLVFALLFAFSFSSCSKSDSEGGGKGGNGGVTPAGYTFNMSIDITPSNSFKKSWVNGDKIYLFFNVGGSRFLNAKKYIVLTYNGSSWSGAQSADLKDISDIGTSGDLCAVYFPFGGVSIVSDGNTGVRFRTNGHTNKALNNLPILTYYMTGKGSYTFNSSGKAHTFKGALNMIMPNDFVCFSIAKSDNNYSSNERYRLSVEGVQLSACVSYTEGLFTSTTIESGQPMWGYYDGKSGIVFSGTLNSTSLSATERKMIFFSDGNPALTKIHSGQLVEHTNTTIEAPATASGWQRAAKEPTSTKINNLYWADYNLGGEQVDDIGWYFGWGQIVPAMGYWSNTYYKGFNPNDALTPWGRITSNLTGDYEIYDVVRAYLGSAWRMAALDDFLSITSFTQQWLTSGSVSAGSFNVPGMKISSDKSLFFPAGNTMEGTAVNSSRAKYSYGNYWSSTYRPVTYHTNVSPEDAYAWVFSSLTSYTTGFTRHSGRLIRPIKK